MEIFKKLWARLTMAGYQPGPVHTLDDERDEAKKMAEQEKKDLGRAMDEVREQGQEAEQEAPLPTQQSA